MVLLPAVVACLASVAMPLPYPDPTPEDAVSGRRPDGRFSVSRNQQEVFARKLGRGRGPSALIQKTPCCLGIQRLVGAVIALKRRPHRGGIEYKIRMLRSAARIIVFSRCRTYHFRSYAACIASQRACRSRIWAKSRCSLALMFLQCLMAARSAICCCHCGDHVL